MVGFKRTYGLDITLANISEWSTTNDTTNNVIKLHQYNGEKPIVTVPRHDDNYINTTIGHVTAFLKVNDFIKRINFNNVPSYTPSYGVSFSNYPELERVNNYPPNLEASVTFMNCPKLTDIGTVPNNTNTIQIYYCNSFNQNFPIPDSVTDIKIFNGTSFNQNIQLPNNLTKIWFSNCTSFNQNIQIPNSITDMQYAFQYCTSLNQNIQIPNSVTMMSCTFTECTSLTNITILSENVSSCTSCFFNTSIPKNVYLPFTYINGVNTITYNTFNNAYGNGQNGVTLIDLNQDTTTLTVNCPSYGIQSFSINGETYMSSDFVNNSLEIRIPKNTDLPFTATPQSGITLYPSSGTINTSTPYTLQMEIYYV